MEAGEAMPHDGALLSCLHSEPTIPETKAEAMLLVMTYLWKSPTTTMLTLLATQVRPDSVWGRRLTGQIPGIHDTWGHLISSVSPWDLLTHLSEQSNDVKADALCI